MSWTEKLKRTVFNGVEWREEEVVANEHPEKRVEGNAQVFQVGTGPEYQGHVTLHADGSVNHHGAFRPHSPSSGEGNAGEVLPSSISELRSVVEGQQGISETGFAVDRNGRITNASEAPQSVVQHGVFGV